LVASKVYYHLQEYNESMVFALGAGKLLNLDNGGEFEETIIGKLHGSITATFMRLTLILAKCVDTFISLSASHKPAVGETPVNLNASFPTTSNGATSTSASLTSPITPFSQSALPSKSLLSRQEDSDFDASYAGGENASVKQVETPLVIRRGVQGQLQAVIEILFEQCFRQKRYRQVVGIAIEARNLDVLRRAILRCSEDEKQQQGETSRRGEELMEYVLDICMGVLQERGFRNEVGVLWFPLVVFAC
jgi:26S proteasome regulatory subunit N2